MKAVIDKAAKHHDSMQAVIEQLRPFGIDGLLQCSIDMYGGPCPRGTSAGRVFDAVSTHSYKELVDRCSPEVILTFDSGDHLVSGRVKGYCEGF